MQPSHDAGPADCTAVIDAQQGVIWQVERVNARLDVVINNASYMDIVSAAHLIGNTNAQQLRSCRLMP